ncbi:MAG: Asp-tRNA(Asn)/Glu-tRNA(Gln) amidotransferase subunit GatC [SAR202 cluster bacterium]|nr:Asp-tRNA(Asn)/Glu-tRNA(Gln) amidotransferase subunit GatC [SAR202 cluster bacterium]
MELAEVRHIAALVRIALTDEEAESFRQQLSSILEQFEFLRQLDTSGVPATGHAVDLGTVLRDDVAQDSLTPEQVLSNAPRREGEFFRVKAVLEE